MLGSLAAAAGSAQQYLGGWPPRITGEDDGTENFTFHDLDSNTGDYFEGNQEGQQTKKIDTDFFDSFEDDFDEADMKLPA